MYNASHISGIKPNTTVWSPCIEKEPIQKNDKITMHPESVVSECHKASLSKIYNCADDIIYILKYRQISDSEFKDICEIINDKLYNHS